MAVGWEDLLADPDYRVISPWLGERFVRVWARKWALATPLREYGWYRFRVSGRSCTLDAAVDPQPELLSSVVRGYLVGDRIVVDDTRVDPNPETIVQFSERVHLIEAGLDRFARVSAGRMREHGPLIYRAPEMPLGPEEDVLAAYMHGVESVGSVKGVTPSLDAAFRMEVWQRAEAARRRAELAELRRAEEARRAVEERKRELVERLGDGASRRQMATIDFAEAARAALAVGGAEYLDHVRAPQPGEMVVRFRLDQRGFECSCDERTLRIIDAGICLTGRSGVRGDSLFTLESISSVIRDAERQRVLVVLRRVGGYENEYEDYEDD